MPETILTDGARLRQAVVNLAGNAVKFTEQGSVRIVASFLPRWRGDQPAVQIEVIDTGIGIREEVLPQLFQPFTQGDASDLPKVRRHGPGAGHLAPDRPFAGRRLDRDQRLGTRQHLHPDRAHRQPRGRSHASASGRGDAGDRRPRLESPIADLKGVRVLLAEDGYDNRRLIETVLRLAGAEVESVENGRLAVAKAEAEPFDVILMDMNMPEMDGYEATRLLRDRGYDRPILALTANAMSGDSRAMPGGRLQRTPRQTDRPRAIGPSDRRLRRQDNGRRRRRVRRRPSNRLDAGRAQSHRSSPTTRRWRDPRGIRRAP